LKEERARARKSPGRTGMPGREGMADVGTDQEQGVRCAVRAV
jgi:hypothetical protein